MNAQGEFFRPTVAPFLGQGDLFNSTPSVGSRIIHACCLVREGAMSSKAAVDEITRIGGPIWQTPKAHVDGLLSDPRWSLRLVLAWILHEGEAERVAEAYECAHRWRLPLDAHPGWRDAYQTLRSALARGRLGAQARYRGEPVSIAAEDWDRLRPVGSGSAAVFVRDGQFHRDRYTDVRFDAAVVMALWKPASPARTKARTTIAIETETRRRLIAMMRADRQHPIPKTQVRAQPEFARVSNRMFDRAWTAAAAAAEAPDWSASGRRKARPFPISKG